VGTTPVGPGAFRTASGDLRAPWRVAVFGMALVACGAAVSAIGFSIAASTRLIGLARIARLPLDQVAIAGSVIAATWLTGRLVHGDGHRVWDRVGFGREAWRARPMLLGASVGALAIAVPSLLMLAFGGMRIESAAAADSPAVAAWAAFALLLPAAVTEEVLVRGYLFSACRDGMGTARAIMVTSALFGLAHLANPEPTVISMIAVTFAGLFLAVVRVTTGSLVAACTAHLAFNLTQVVALHAPVSGLALETPGYRTVPVGPDWLTGGAWGPEGGAGVIAALALASFIIWNRSPVAHEPTTPTPAATP